VIVGTLLVTTVASLAKGRRSEPVPAGESAELPNRPVR
jgi:hypothetical protein